MNISGRNLLRTKNDSKKGVSNFLLSYTISKIKNFKKADNVSILIRSPGRKRQIFDEFENLYLFSIFGPFLCEFLK